MGPERRRDPPGTLSELGPEANQALSLGSMRSPPLTIRIPTLHRGSLTWGSRALQATARGLTFRSAHHKAADPQEGEEQRPHAGALSEQSRRMSPSCSRVSFIPGGQRFLWWEGASRWVCDHGKSWQC